MGWSRATWFWPIRGRRSRTLELGLRFGLARQSPTSAPVEAFKKALLAAKSVGYLQQDGTSGSYLHGLFERLGISEGLKKKIVRPPTDIVSELVAKGEIELGMVVITQIVTTPGVELVGPIPSERNSILCPMEWRSGRKLYGSRRGQGIAQISNGSYGASRLEGTRHGARLAATDRACPLFSRYRVTHQRFGNRSKCAISTLNAPQKKPCVKHVSFDHFVGACQ